MHPELQKAHALLETASQVHRRPIHGDILTEIPRRNQEALGIRLEAAVHAITALVESLPAPPPPPCKHCGVRGDPYLHSTGCPEWKP